jgi:hypothetical protein
MKKIWRYILPSIIVTLFFLAGQEAFVQYRVDVWDDGFRVGYSMAINDSIEDPELWKGEKNGTSY